MRFFSHFCMNSYYPKTKETRYMHGKPGTISHFWWEIKYTQPAEEALWRFFKQLKQIYPCNLVMHCEVYIANGNEINTLKKYSQLYYHCKIKQKREWPMWTATDGWMKNMCYVHMCYVYKERGICIVNKYFIQMKLYDKIKRNKYNLWIQKDLCLACV